MLKAWKEEEDMLNGQIKVLKKHTDHFRENEEKIKMLESEIESIQHMVQLSNDPHESKRLQGMCDMHTRFVRTLESLVPLLKEKCPQQDWNLNLDEEEKETLRRQK